MSNEKFILASLEDEKFKNLAEILGNKTCKKIIDYLGDVREASEKDIADELNIPLNTVEYNLKKLIKVKLVEIAKNHFWSVKGRKIKMYKLVRKYIVISPEKGFSLNKLKSIIPVVLGAGVISYLINLFYSSTSSEFSKSVYAPEATGVSTQNLFLDSTNNFAFLNSPGFWFLVGVLVMVIIFFIFNWGKKKMKDSIKITLIIMGGVLILGLMAIFVVMQFVPAEQVEVSGVSKVEISPDLMVFYLEILRTGEDYEYVQDLVDESYNNFVNDLVESGFEEEDIETTFINMDENWNWNGHSREREGYRVSQKLKFKINTSELEKLSYVLDSIARNNISLDYSNFELSSELESEYKKISLEQATSNAREKAEAIARGLDKRVGKVISVSNSDFNYYPWAYSGNFETLSVESFKEITPDVKVVNSRVSVIYKIY